jgi:hypothetical protein
MPQSTPMRSTHARNPPKMYEYYISSIALISNVNVLNLHRIDLARKYYTHLQREIEKEEAR